MGSRGRPWRRGHFHDPELNKFEIRKYDSIERKRKLTSKISKFKVRKRKKNCDREQHPKPEKPE